MSTRGRPRGAAAEGSQAPGGERLQKVLARAGLGSRRAVEELIARGRVRVNGAEAQLGRRVDASKDVIEVEGSRIPLAPGLVHLLMNKPVGVVSTAADPRARSTVLDLLDDEVRVWPVGRLDADSEGALILTNDGDLTHRLTHASFDVPKTYLVEARGHVRAPALRQLARGVELEDGPTRRAEVRLQARRGDRSLVEVTISEGRNRQVRRMFDAVGHPVRRLVRVRIGPLMLGRLRPGTYRRLSLDEVRRLYQACGL